MLFETPYPQIQICGAIHCWDASEESVSEDTAYAYQAAHRIVFEAGLRAPADLSIGNCQNGKRLSTMIAPHLLTGVLDACRNFKLPFDGLDHLKAWMAAIQLLPHQFALRGLSMEKGIDKYIFAHALADRKMIDSFEILEEPLALFDAAPIAEQEHFLGRAISPVASVEGVRLLNAARSQDVRILEEIAAKVLEEMPQLFNALIPQRNIRWKRTILEKFNDGIPTLIVVGTLHCVGPSAVQNL